MIDKFSTLFTVEHSKINLNVKIDLCFFRNEFSVSFISIVDQFNDIPFVIETSEISYFYPQLQREDELIYTKENPHEALLRIKVILKCGNKIFVHLDSATYSNLLDIIKPIHIGMPIKINLKENDIYKFNETIKNINNIIKLDNKCIRDIKVLKKPIK